jgi:hypothetical protein
MRLFALRDFVMTHVFHRNLRVTPPVAVAGRGV